MKITWADDTKRALEILGDANYHHLSKIYSKVYAIRAQRKATLKNYEQWTRNALQNNSRGKGRNLFEPRQIRSGYWRLKKSN